MEEEDATVQEEVDSVKEVDEYDDCGGLFVMRHRANSMSASRSTRLC